MSEEDINIEQIKADIQDITENIEQLRFDKENIVLEIKKDVKKWYKKWIGYIVGGISALTIIALIQIYFSVISKTETFVTEKVTKKFDEPEIAHTFTLIAGNEAKKIIENKLTPALEEANKIVSMKIDSFEKSLQEFKYKYDIELEKLAQEIEYIKNRNEILKLGDEAIATKDAKAFEELETIYESSADQGIKISALSEILRVKSHFATGTSIKGINVTSTNRKTGEVLIDDNIPTADLVRGLIESKSWEIRAKIAEILRKRKEKQVPEALLYTIQNDNNLEVRKRAMDGFESVTGFRSSDVFNYDPAKKWWEENKERIEKDLKDSDK